MNDTNLYTISKALTQVTEIRFSYRSPSGSIIPIKGVPTAIRCNKNGLVYVAVTQPGYGYGTWSVDKIVGFVSYS